MDKNYRSEIFSWYTELRNLICQEFEKIEEEYAQVHKNTPGKFQRKKWDRPGGGGGVMSVMKGEVFEKVGVNISEVHGEFSDEFKSQIPGTGDDAKFYACGISLVAHMKSPLVPSVHMNTRFIETSRWWFGGGMDLTPAIEFSEDSKDWHQANQQACDKHDPKYYPKFKKQCDEYFHIKHRGEARGIGGTFYDYHNSGNMDDDFAFTQDIGKAFLEVFPKLVRRRMNEKWTQKQKEKQLIKRGRYAEFNLLYDRGTKFGLMTDGNVEAILMSMPPEAKWP
ncbi:MAG: oxygen-dependent coproporphyrinogen oxidase [Rickettsiales bacterium]